MLMAFMATDAGGNPRKILFQRQRTATERGGPHFGDASGIFCGLEKGDILNNKAKIQFEHDLEASVKVLEKELHQQRLTALRELADKLKDSSWKYPSLEHLFGL